MRTLFHGTVGFACSVLVVLFLFGLIAEEAQAQRPTHRWLDVGAYASPYTNGGGYWISRYRVGGGNWPYLSTSTNRNAGYHNARRLWIGAKDWTDETGREWPYKIAYTDVSTMGDGIFETEYKLVSKYPKPDVTVDGFRTERVEVPVDEVDPDIIPDRKVVTRVNTVLGVEMHREVWAFSQDFHQDYHIFFFTLTNNGNVDGDDDIELADQTVEDIYVWWDRRSGTSLQSDEVVQRGARWGTFDMKEVIRDSDLKANIAWLGYVPAFQGGWDPLGAPALNSSAGIFPNGQDTSGRLHGAIHFGYAKVHADRSPTDRANDSEQPYTHYWMSANDANATGAPPSHVDESIMQLHYEEWFTHGFKQPTHAQSVQPDGDYVYGKNDPNIVSGGVRHSMGFGPYTLGPGESVNIVMVEGVAGLNPDNDAAIEIGRTYKRLWEQDPDNAHRIPIPFDGNGDGQIDESENLTKNEWAVLAPRDSIEHMFRKAIANYQSGFQIPREPRPPSRLEVLSDIGGVTLNWDYPAENPPGGFEIYRSENFYQGNPADYYQYELVAQLPGDARTHFDDHEVERGVDYYYYIQAIGDVNNDATGLTPTGKRLRSNRYYAQTYSPANIKRVPGETMADARVVPNPFHVGADSEVSFAGAERIAFLDIPGNCTIRIYTERGDLVQTIEHTDGTGDELWDLQTDAQQMVVSGLYIAAIADHDTGDTGFLKFIVIR